MKTISSLLKIWPAALLLFGFSQCNSQKIVMVENPPFVLGEVMSEAWVAGVEGGGSGTNLFIPVEGGKEIMLDSVYFRGQAVKPERIERDSYLVYIGRFKGRANQQEDMILHEDPKKEGGNKPPELRKKIPFDLEDDEAVVSFKDEGKTKYYKIENIKESPTMKLPQTKPQKGQGFR